MQALDSVETTRILDDIIFPALSGEAARSSLPLWLSAERPRRRLRHLRRAFQALTPVRSFKVDFWQPELAGTAIQEAAVQSTLGIARARARPFYRELMETRTFTIPNPFDGRPLAAAGSLPLLHISVKSR